MGSTCETKIFRWINSGNSGGGRTPRWGDGLKARNADPFANECYRFCFSTNVAGVSTFCQSNIDPGVRSAERKAGGIPRETQDRSIFGSVPGQMSLRLTGQDLLQLSVAGSMSRMIDPPDDRFLRAKF